MNIKHLVISGGGPNGLVMIKTCMMLIKNKYIDINKIETIFATSAGAICALLIAIIKENDMISNDLLFSYLINRDYTKDFSLNLDNIINMNETKGLNDFKCIIKFFLPLFHSILLPLDINLHDFYNRFKIDIHFFTTKLNTFETIDVNYKSFPNLKVFDALSMTCAIPIIFTPFCYDNCFFVDGGLLCNYPLQKCIEFNNCELNEILGFKNIADQPPYYDCSMNITSYLAMYYYSCKKHIDTTFIQPEIPYELFFEGECMTPQMLTMFVENKESRKEYIDKGIKYYDDFIESLDKTKTSS